MTDEDLTAASNALMRWFKSQGIGPRASITVMIPVLLLAIHDAADGRSEQIRKVQRGLADTIRHAIVWESDDADD